MNRKVVSARVLEDVDHCRIEVLFEHVDSIADEAELRQFTRELVKKLKTHDEKVSHFYRIIACLAELAALVR